jgi:methyl-accepting chemotaxis protein
VEKRTHVRYEVTLPAEIIWNNGGARLACTIKDISLEGARIDTGEFVAVPPKIYLFENDSAQLFECEVRWQNCAQIGLFFVDIGSPATRRALITRNVPASPA